MGSPRRPKMMKAFDKMVQALAEGRIKIFNPYTDPLPKWKMQNNGLGDPKAGSVGYTCDDPREHAFALAVMARTGWSLPEFDVWLDSIGQCGARVDLMIRRRWLRDAVLADNEGRIYQHLEWMYIRRGGIERERTLQPLVQRDAKRQAGTRKPRKSRMPALDSWLDDELDKDPTVTPCILWKSLPTDYDSLGTLYLEDDKVREIGDYGREHAITRKGFDKRVRKAKKRKSSANN